MQTLEANNLVTRPFKGYTFRTPDEIYTTSYDASTVSGNTVAWRVRSPSNSALMSSIVYMRFRVKLTIPKGAFLTIPGRADTKYYSSECDIAKSDVMPVQCYACNSQSLTINGTTMNWRPNEILRELLTSQIHKDALKQIC
jgi:hypothetical protein